MSSRPISPSPVRPPPAHRDFSPPPRVRSPPPFAPVPRVLSPPFTTSPPPTSGYISPPPPPILNIQPSTPQSAESTHSAPTPQTSTTETTPNFPASKSLDAIHEVLETGEGSESESGQKISSNSSSLILPPTSPQRKPTGGPPVVGPLQPLEGQRSMTVEVTSKPPPQLATTEKDKDKISKAEAILKSVKSNDTIKAPSIPKPKKKRSRATNIANTNSSKAEIFAAKVAAVVDANPDSSDSDEAFVYDSNTNTNPPNSSTVKQRPGMHSRTPSMTSINSAYAAGNPTYGTVPAGRSRPPPASTVDETYSFPTITRAQGRSLQQGKNTYTSSDENRRRSVLPEDSLFAHNQPSRHTLSPQPSKSPLPRSSPRTKGTLPRNGGTVKTPKWAQSHFYDGDDDDTYPPEDERVPLLPRDMNRSTTRRFKGYKGRNRVISAKQQAQINANYERRRSGRYSTRPQNGSSRCWPGLAGTAILVTTLLVLTMLTVGFVFQTSRSLENVRLTNITNIVVSQEELIMDISVEAGNPNILPVIAGESLSVDVFARSDHFDDLPRQPRANKRDRAFPFWPPWGRDPPKKGDGHNVTEGTSLLLGTVRALEAPLTFPPTSFRRAPVIAQRGEMKLVNPAVNATNGTEKWRKAILYNFELIVRGTMKYRAPIGGRERAVGIEWRGTVDPLRNRVWDGEEWTE